MRRRVVLAEATTGLMVAGGLFTVAVAIVLCTGVESRPLWADRTRVTTLMCVFTLPLVVGVSAIVAARRVTGLGAVAAASPLGALHPAVVAAWAGSAWATVVCAVQTVIPLLVQFPTDPVPWTALLSWSQAWVSLVAGAWLGAWCGARLRTRAAGPLLALVMLVALYLSNYLSGRLLLAAPFDSTWYVPWIQPAAGAPIGHTLVAAGIGVAAAAALRASLNTMLAAGAALIVFGVAGVLLIDSVADPLRYEPRPMPEGPVCRDIGGDVVFCTHPLAGATGDAAWQALIQVRRVVGDRWHLPAVLAQIDMLTIEGARVVPMGYGADDAAHLDNAVWGLLPECADTQAGFESREHILEWLRIQVGGSRADNPFADAVPSTLEEQDAWVQEVLRAGSCT